MPTSDVARDIALLAAPAAILALLLTLLLLGRRWRRRRAGRTTRAGADGRPPRAAVVVHGAKIDAQDPRRRQIEVASTRLGWRAPIWLSTTADDPGRGQTEEALASGACAVLAFGGDGTARIVAGALAGSGVPMGLLPAGTGNLLARNLGIPVNRLEGALQVALTGRDRAIDVGRVEFAATPEATPRPEAFMVMAGLGFDAEVMAGTGPELKQRLGWVAYVISGTQRLRGRRTPVTIQVDGGPVRERRIRTVVVGNCGTLQGGIQLLPAAVPDDGWLDVVVVAPRSLLGWLTVTRAVITRREHSTVEHFRCRSIEVRAERPLHAQLDGDPVGTARLLRAHVDPMALVVRVPH